LWCKNVDDTAPHQDRQIVLIDGWPDAKFAALRAAYASSQRLGKPISAFGASRALSQAPRAHGSMATQQELSNFLASVERRAFKQAVFAVRNDESALDIVQDAMINLSEHYGERPAAELPLLFTRILKNKIHDHFRRQKVRNTWITLFSALGPGDDEDFDPLESLEALEGSAQAESAADKYERTQVVGIIEEEIARLPGRQREAFLLRYWEDFDVAETAAAMGCSEGSVKTHCSRATHALAKALRARGITL
jgi:RNA polymerase sigma-70 factor (ECF subfamily)